MTDDSHATPDKAPAGAWLDEGLYWRGEEAPVEPGTQPRDWVEVPHEHFIPVPKARLKRTLRADRKAVASGERFGHLLEMVEAVYHVRYLRILNELKDDYELFRPDTGAIAREGLSGAELAARQNRFLANLLRALVRGNFLSFSAHDYTRAAEHTYLLDLPVEVDWRGHDDRLLAGFYAWADGPDGDALRRDLGLGDGVRSALDPPAAIGEHAWVFYRGYERAQTEGRFLAQKLDILVTRLLRALTYPVAAPIGWVIERARGVPPVDPKAGAEATPHPRTTVWQRRWLKRTSLHNQPLGRSLFRRSHLQEPAMRQVVTLFRLRPAKTQSLTGRAQPDPAAPDAIDWTIRLKMFRHIPLADSEIVFPEKVIRMRSTDLAVLVASAVAVVPAVLKAWREGGGAALAVLTVLVMTIVKLVGNYRRVRRAYVARMTRDLYDKNLDNDVGVLQFLVDSLEEQEVKEALLCYWALWEADAPLTASEIDARIERLLQERFGGVEVDLEVLDALRKVTEPSADDPRALGIVETETETPDGGPAARYRARPLDEALRILDTRWDGMFQYSVAPPSATAGGCEE